MSSDNLLTPPYDLSSSRQSQFSAAAALPLLTTSWEQVLMHRNVSSRVTYHHVLNWRKNLQQDGSDAFAYWVRYFHHESDGKELADAILCALQEMLDGHQDSSAESCRNLRYVLFRYANECETVPSTLFISGPKFESTERPTQGAYSDVYRGSFDDRPVALKTLRVPQDVSSQSFKILPRKALLWRQMKHPNILPFLGLTKLDHPYPSVYMVSPWISGGSLYSWLRTQTNIQLSHKISWIWQICDGLRYLHDMSLIHGDLRGANILLNADRNAVIADFGLAQLMDAGDTTMSMTDRTGAVRWMAPEVLGNAQCSYASDAYSFGCTCLEIVTQTHPFPELSDRELKAAVVKGTTPQWPDISAEMTVVDRIGLAIGPCFAREPGSRPRMEELASRLKAIIMPEDDADESKHPDVLDQAPWKNSPSQNLDDIRSDMSLETQEQAIKAASSGLPRILKMFGCHPAPDAITKELRLKEPHHISFAAHGRSVVTCLIFSHGRIISASDDHSIHVYNPSTGTLIHSLDGHEGGVWSIAATKNTLVSGSTDRTVRIWDLTTGRCTHVFGGHTSTVRRLAIVKPEMIEMDTEGGIVTREKWPKRPLVVTGSRDHSLRVWTLPRPGDDEYRCYGADDTEADPSDEEVDDNPYHQLHLEGHEHAVRDLAARGRTLVSGSYDCTVRVWDIITGTCKWVLVGHTQKVYSVVLDIHRNLACSGSMDGTVRVWNLSTGTCQHTLTGHTSLIGLLGLSPSYLVSAAADSTLRVWNPDSGELLHILTAHNGAITCFQHDEFKVLSGSDGTLKMWDIRDGSQVCELLTDIVGVWQVVFEGRWCIAANNRNDATMLDVWDFGRNGDDEDPVGELSGGQYDTDSDYEDEDE